jgi:hypothetical protein
MTVMAEQVYVSITGLRVKKLWHMPIFIRHALASAKQAQAAEGCLSVATRGINGVHHTRTVWQSRDHMRAFLYSGAHKKAIQSFTRIATGKTFGFETDSVPDWDAVHKLWHEKGRDYG